MKLKISKPFWQAAGLGVLAGMRCSAAPVVASQMLSDHPTKKLEKSPLRFMQSNKVATAMKFFAAFELVGDKLPKTPNRTKSMGLVFRCLSGSLAAASIFKAAGYNPLLGAAIGSVAAFGSTFGSYLLRNGTVDKTGAFDPLIGAIEDALVVGAGVGLVRSA